MFPSEKLSRMPNERLEAEIATRYSRLSAEHCQWLLLVAELDRREGHRAWGCQTCAQWLSWHCGIAMRSAQEQVRVARKLADFPLVTAAFARGELTYSKVRALTRVADQDSEKSLLELARCATAQQLERVASAYRRATRAEDPERITARRYADLRWDEDGCLVVSARLAPEEGALVLKALDVAGDELDRERSDDCVAHERGDGHAIRLARPAKADALVRLAERSLAAHEGERSGGDATQIVVHVDAGELAEPGDVAPQAESGARPGRCEVEGGPGLHTATARRLACDAAVVPIHERSDGEPLSVGRKTRSIPPAIRRALRARDGGCRFPGCSATRFVDAHHIEHWADGGSTALGNLILLCRRHHRLIHEGGFALEARDGQFVFRNRHGQPLPAAPQLPGAERAAARLAAELGTVEPRKLGTPLAKCAPRNGPDPLDLHWAIATIMGVRDHRRRLRERRLREGSAQVEARAGPTA